MLKKATVEKLANMAADIDFLRLDGFDTADRSAIAAAAQMLHDVAERIDTAQGFGLYATEDSPC
jgi:hypothetical protein